MDQLGSAEKKSRQSEEIHKYFSMLAGKGISKQSSCFLTLIPDRWRAVILRIFSCEVLFVFVFYFDRFKHSNFYPNILLYIIQTITGMIKYLWKNVKILSKEKIRNELLQHFSVSRPPLKQQNS